MPSQPLSAKKTRAAVKDLADKIDLFDRALGWALAETRSRLDRAEKRLPPSTLRGRLRWLLLGR